MYNQVSANDDFFAKLWMGGYHVTLTQSIDKTEIEQKINDICLLNNLKDVLLINSDFEGVIDNIPDNLIILRQSFQYSNKHIQEVLIPSAMGSSFKNIDLYIVKKTNKPKVSFCGNVNTFYDRQKILNILSNSEVVDTYFINSVFNSNIDKKYYNDLYLKNLNSSEFTLCPRGNGNFSIRFYESLQHGKIPIIINTDIELPFNHIINWKKHIVICNTYAELVNNIYNFFINNDIEEVQVKNSILFKEYFIEKYPNLMFDNVEKISKFIQFKNLNEICVLIYSIGKSGGTSLYYTLSMYNLKPIYIHNLNSLQYYGNYDNYNNCNENDLINYLAEIQNKKNKNFYVIYIYRNLIDTFISGFFENILLFFENKYSLDTILNFEVNIIFEKLFSVFDIQYNIYNLFWENIINDMYENVQFDLTKKNLTYISKNNILVNNILIRFDDINDWTTILSNILNVNIINIDTKNMSKDKPYFTKYNKIKNQIIFPERIKNTIRNDKFLDYFYTAEEKQKLFNKYNIS
jgi:hypothetical protein